MKLGTPAYALSVQQRAVGSPYHNNSALSLHASMFLLPYSLELTPPSIISPPLLFAEICRGGIFISNLSPPLTIS